MHSVENTSFWLQPLHYSSLPPSQEWEKARVAIITGNFQNALAHIPLDALFEASDQDIAVLIEPLLSHPFSEPSFSLVKYLLRTRMDVNDSYKFFIRVGALACPTMRSHLLLSRSSLSERDFEEGSYKKRNKEAFIHAIIEGIFSSETPLDLDRAPLHAATPESLSIIRRLASPYLQFVNQSELSSEQQKAAHLLVLLG